VYVDSGSVYKKTSDIYAEWQFSMMVNIWAKEKIHTKDVSGVGSRNYNILMLRNRLIYACGTSEGSTFIKLNLK
jgi:hypothetical protein